MSKNAGRTPHGGVHSVQNRSESGRRPARGGRPESESNTPVNIEDGLYRDNGERVAATPPSYPLVRRRSFGWNSRLGPPPYVGGTVPRQAPAKPSRKPQPPAPETPSIS